jgi:hypothetical protein
MARPKKMTEAERRIHKGTQIPKGPTLGDLLKELRVSRRDAAQIKRQRKRHPTLEKTIRKYDKHRSIQKRYEREAGILKGKISVERVVSRRGRYHWAEAPAPSMPQTPQTAFMDSTVISKFEYDPEDMILTIWFTSGHIYEYEDVTPQTVRSLYEAPSKGHYFYYNIRTNYKYTRIK